MSNPGFPQNTVPNYNSPPDPVKKNNTNIILFPVFAQARSKAHTASCMSNEKQMIRAALMYVADNDERYPVSTEWMTKTLPYTKNERVYQCPAAPSTDPARHTVFSYAYNSKMSGRNIADLLDPAITAVIYDSSTLAENASDPLTSLPVPPRHDLFNVLSFADGHVKSLTADALQALLDDPAQKSLFSK